MNGVLGDPLRFNSNSHFTVVMDNGLRVEVEARDRWVLGRGSSADQFEVADAVGHATCFGRVACGHAACFGRVACGNHRGREPELVESAAELESLYQSTLGSLPAGDATVEELFAARRTALTLAAS